MFLGRITASSKQRSSPNAIVIFPISKRKSSPCMQEKRVLEISITNYRIYIGSDHLWRWSVKSQISPALSQGLAVSPSNSYLPFVFVDCTHSEVRKEGQILSWVVYVVFGVTVERYKEIFSIIVVINETSKFRPGMLNNLKNADQKMHCSFCRWINQFEEVISLSLNLEVCEPYVTQFF